MAMADRKVRDAKEQTKKMHTALEQWKRHAQELQSALNEQVIETARIGVLRETILTELLKVNPNHWLKDREARVKLANDKSLVAKEVTLMGRADLADKV
ncbi:MAG: hypothetical protein BroJett038_24110 [Chloroflexota bacterium]|nr:MAG: hypothetical protein BroJett038_24110 [Chloroflexota bacterium]